MEKNRSFFNRFRNKKESDLISLNKKDSDIISLNDSVYEYVYKPIENKENFKDSLDNMPGHIYPVQELEAMIENCGDTDSLYSEKISRLLENDKSSEIGENTKKYLKYNNQDCVDFFLRHNEKEYTDEEKKFRNDILFNTDHERFKSQLDPWLFVEQKDIVWPNYVKKIYYTRLTPYKSLVRLSYSTNLYLNKLFQTQDFAPVLRIFFCPIYEMTSSLLREPTRQDVFNTFVNEDFIMNYGNVEIINRDTELIERDFHPNDKEIFSKNVEEEQLTNIAYRSFFDYIPICMCPHKENKNYNDILFSDICFHKNNCHDNSCTTHNTKNISYKNAHEHSESEEMYNINEEQLIKCKSLMKF